jgi:hypothetical protein
MKTARDCVLILTVFTFASGMRYITDEEYSHNIGVNVARLLQHDPDLSVFHDLERSISGLSMFRNLNVWLRLPSRQAVADYGLALNPLPEELSLAYAGERSADFNSTANTFSLWIPEPDTSLP